MEWPFYVPEQIEQRRLLREAKAARLEAEGTTTMTNHEIALAVIKARNSHLSEGIEKYGAKFGWCGCSGPRNGDPLCPCQMESIERDIEFIRRLLEGPQAPS
jgi:hypothetical protein